VNHPEIIIVPAFFATVAYVVWVIVNAWQRKQRTKLLTDFNARLLDKLGSVKDFSEFLHTPAGARFMHDLAAEPQATDGPKQRILRAAQLGIVLSSLGLGLLALSFFWSPYASDNGQTAFASLGVIALSLGVGFGVSAAASYRVSGALGLLGHAESAARTPATSEL
jgi:hypothetical protein